MRMPQRRSWLWYKVLMRYARLPSLNPVRKPILATLAAIRRGQIEKENVRTALLAGDRCTCQFVFQEVSQPQPQRTPRKLDVASLEAKILKDCDAWRRDPTLSTIRTGMDEQSGGDTVRQPSSATMQMLMTYAMGVENDRYATLENDMDSPNSHACRSAETSGFHAIALCIVSTATSAMISRGTAKNAKLVKLDAS
jgi:hypothetical protein